MNQPDPQEVEAWKRFWEIIFDATEAAQTLPDFDTPHLVQISRAGAKIRVAKTTPGGPQK